MSEERDAQFVEMVVKEIVDHPEDVKVERNIDEMGVLITLNVNAADMGQIIGKEGSTAKALRTLLRVIGAKNSSRVNLKINEPEGGKGPGPRKEEAPAEAPAEEKPAESVDDVVGDLKL